MSITDRRKARQGGVSPGVQALAMKRGHASSSNWWEFSPSGEGTGSSGFWGLGLGFLRLPWRESYRGAFSRPGFLTGTGDSTRSAFEIGSMAEYSKLDSFTYRQFEVEV